jgi:dihydrofolate reductase
VTFAHDAAACVRALRAEPDEAPVYLVGGGELAATLYRERLIDEVHLKINPSLSGRGIPLFSPDVRGRLTHLSTQTFDSGVVLVRYRVG